MRRGEGEKGEERRGEGRRGGEERRSRASEKRGAEKRRGEEERRRKERRGKKEQGGVEEESVIVLEPDSSQEHKQNHPPCLRMTLEPGVTRGRNSSERPAFVYLCEVTISFQG